VRRFIQEFIARALSFIMAPLVGRLEKLEEFRFTAIGFEASMLERALEAQQAIAYLKQSNARLVERIVALEAEQVRLAESNVAAWKKADSKFHICDVSGVSA
jgi:hypothetical protein